MGYKQFPIEIFTLKYFIELFEFIGNLNNNIKNLHRPKQLTSAFVLIYASTKEGPHSECRSPSSMLHNTWKPSE